MQAFSNQLAKLPWTEFIHSVRGRSCIAPLVGTLPHPAASLLDSLRRVGAPVLSTTRDWSREQKDAAAFRGSHKSADSYKEFVHEEMADFIHKRYWIVLPYEQVKTLPNLQLSPLGVVPQRERRPRLIVDYTFSSVNQETKRLAHREAMQFGRALERVLRTILEAPDEHGPCYLLKIDLSDGFYRVQVDPEHVAQLGVVLPGHGSPNNPWIGFPLVLPMGWCESPPHFCSFTETIVDLSNRYIEHWDPPLHPLEALASTPPEPDGRHSMVVPAPSRSTETRPQSTPFPTKAKAPGRRRCQQRPRALHVDVYVDDEIAVAQGTAPRLNRLRRGLLHLNDSVFRPNDTQDNAERKEPVSTKKLQKGDACWSTRKQVLGWDIDTLQKTLELPPHRQDRLLEILGSVRGKRRVGIKAMRKLLGELRSMVPGIPGGRGMFSQLQYALKTQQRNRVRLHQAARDHLEDFWLLAQDLAKRPTRIAELLPQAPSLVGASDAAKQGMGGVWLADTQAPLHPPILWRVPFPDHIQKALVSTKNPTGTITNSDLELAGTIVHTDVIVQAVDCRERTLGTGCDNTPAVSWQRKGSVTTKGAAAYLLREASLHQRSIVMSTSSVMSLENATKWQTMRHDSST